MQASKAQDQRGYLLLASIGPLLTLNELRDGAVVRVDSLSMPLNVQYACFHPRLGIAYVACSNGGVASLGDRHCLVQVRYGQRRLELVADAIALPYRPIHVSIDPLGRRLAIAYNRPAAVTRHELDAQGAVSEDHYLVDDPVLIGHFPHQILPIPSKEDWLLTCRGDDASPAAPENPGCLGVLTDSGQAITCSQRIAPNGGYGFGPRNCAFHADGRTLYAVLERQNQLLGFRCRGGTIEPQPRWVMNLLERPLEVRHPQLGGAIVLHPGGRHAYVVNRWHPVPADTAQPAPCGENSIVVFALDPDGGKPAVTQRVPLSGLHARCITLSHDGHFLVAAPRQPGRYLDESGRIVECTAGFTVYRVMSDGRLERLGHHAVDVGRDQLFWADFCPA